MYTKQDIDGIRISETDNNRYANTRKRLIRFAHNEYISDKEIIEYLAEEIEQYRERIRKQEDTIKELNKNKESIDVIDYIFHCGINGEQKKYSVREYYEDGKLIKEEIEPV